MTRHDFPIAGDPSDIHEAYVEGKIDQYAEVGRQLLVEARSSADAHRLDDSEGAARRALQQLARSLDWAEDSDREDERHRELDAAGKYVRETYGCVLPFEDGQYFRTCPVDLAHTRVGLSVGGTAKRICSLCGEDVSECPHLPNKAYLVPGGSSDLGWCRVCLERGPCDHDPGHEYRTDVVSIITEMQVDEVSIVGKPSHPEARLTRVSVSTRDLSEALGETFSPGIAISCDICLRPCNGLVKRHSG